MKKFLDMFCFRFLPIKVEYKSMYSSISRWQRHKILHILLIAKKTQPRREMYNCKKWNNAKVHSRIDTKGFLAWSFVDGVLAARNRIKALDFLYPWAPSAAVHNDLECLLKGTL